jgi:hypothetical protein
MPVILNGYQSFFIALSGIKIAFIKHKPSMKRLWSKISFQQITDKFKEKV